MAAHAHGAEGIKLAVRAGVASIEHGSFLDEEGARMMAQHGTYLVPTISAGEAVEKAAKSGRLKGLRAEKALAAAAAMRNGVKIALTNGVPIALGTDAGVGAHGANGHEFTLMVEWGGMTPMQSIVAGTISGAQAARLGQATSARSRRASGRTSSPCRAIPPRHHRHGEAELRDEGRRRLQWSGSPDLVSVSSPRRN